MARIIFCRSPYGGRALRAFLGIAHRLYDWHPPLQALLLYDQYPQKSFKKFLRHRRVARGAATGYRIRRWPSQTVVTDESWKVPSQGGGIHGGTR